MYKLNFGVRSWRFPNESEVEVHEGAEAQEREASLARQLLNRMRELGRPQSYPVG